MADTGSTMSEEPQAAAEQATGSQQPALAPTAVKQEPEPVPAAKQEGGMQEAEPEPVVVEAVVKDEQPGVIAAQAEPAVKEQLPAASVKQEEAAQASSSKVQEPTASTSGQSRQDEEALLKEFFSEMRDVDRDNEVNRILWAFKLNPFEKLNLRFDATYEDIRKAYRRISLAVHPDKCKHPQAAAAFEILGTAQKDLLDEEKRAALMIPLNMARDEVRKERKKATKNDTAIQLASLLHENGREGIEADWEKSDEFHEKWKMKARDILAKHAWRKQGLTKRIKDETERCEQEEKEARENAKKARTHEQEWEKTRETRVGTWRDFQQQKGSKKKVAGELRPPKLKTNDEDKLYVQRPVGEQFRPPPPKPAGKKGKPAF